MIVADLAYNLVLSATPALLTEDVIVLLAAAAFLGHGFVPQRFGKERDFVLLFFIALNAILVVPLLVARLYYQDFERSVDLYSWIALAPETGAILSVVGVPNTVQAVAGSTAPGLTFTPLHLGVPVTVVITTACSGIYSFGIFASAFVAFVMTEYERPSTRLWAFLGLGFLAAYIANVLRLVVIVLVGFHTDTSQTDLQNMLVAHTYAGWLIFLAWVALFWSLLFRFVPVQPTTVEGGRLPTRRNESRCGICGNALSPAIPATKCACGAYHHRACIENAKRCSSCGRMVSVSVEGSLSYADVGG